MRFGTLLATMVLATMAACPTLAADTAAPYTVLITGANRGIGYELARQYAELGWTVIATARKPRESADLQKLAKTWDNVRVEKLDVTSDRSVRSLAARYKGVPIDVLINNAGILGDITAQKYGTYDFDVYDEVADVNFKGPLRMVEAFMDNVATSRQKKIMNMSSAVGSIEMTFGGQVFYRSSKAALNMAMRTLSKEVKRDPDPNRKALIFGMINPGIVDTGFAKNVPVPMITARESAEKCIAVIESYTPDKSGTFLDYNKGAKLPW
ncbi:MAG: SDR family oxidoreductase [Chromatiales bacterium]|nr:SDR family oxidoreductase [Chromatiales bacterium]